MVTLPQEATVNGGTLMFCEPHAIQLSNGTIALAIRVQSTDKTIVASTLRCYYCTSDDQGKTWTTPEVICAQDGEELFGTPPHLLEMKDGGLMMSYSRRAAPCGNRAIISYDCGKTWSQEIYLSQTWNPEDTDLGYPATVELEEGSFVTVYYQRYLLDSFPSFLYTKWSIGELDLKP